MKNQINNPEQDQSSGGSMKGKLTADSETTTEVQG